MSEKIWSNDAWEDYLYWQTQDKKTLKRINQLIQDIERNGLLTLAAFVKYPCKHGYFPHCSRE